MFLPLLAFWQASPKNIGMPYLLSPALLTKRLSNSVTPGACQQ